MTSKNGKISKAKAPVDPPPAKKLKTRQCDTLDPALIVEGRCSHTPSSRMRESSITPIRIPPASMRHEASKACADKEPTNKEPAVSKPPSVTKSISLSKPTYTTLSTTSRRSEADSTAKMSPSTKTGQQPLSIIPEDEGEQNIPNDID
jgi:hypothetical protein